jgi:hypothetical protein
MAWLQSSLLAFSYIQDVDNDRFANFAKTFAPFAVNSSVPSFSFLINNFDNHVFAMTSASFAVSLQIPKLNPMRITGLAYGVQWF